MSDSVNHPAHYNSLGAKCSACGHPIECIDVVERMTFSIGNCIKYLWRAGKKGDLAEDLKKAIWYAERELYRVTGRASEADRERVLAAEYRKVTDAKLDSKDAELADYERTVATLREQLRESERGRSASNAVDAAARRLMASAVEAQRVEGQPSDEARLLVDERCLRRLAMAIADAGKVST